MKKTILYFFIITNLFFCTFSFAQENKLEKQQFLTDTSAIVTYIKQSQKLPDTLLLEKIERSNQIIEASKKIAFEKGLAYGHWLRARANYVLGNYDVALSDFQICSQMENAVTSPNFMSDVFFHLGKIHEIRQSYNQVLPYYEKALQAAQKRNNQRMENVMLGQIGNLYGLQGDFRKQLSYNIKAMKNFESQKDSGALIASYNDVGFGYNQLAFYDSAAFFTEKAIKIAENFKYNEYLAVGYGNLGEIYLLLKNYPKSIFYAQKGLDLAKKVRSKRSAAQNLSVLYQSYRQIQNLEKAFENLEILNTLKDSLYNESQTEAIRKLETNFTIKEKQKENQALQLENQSKSQEISLQQRLNLLISFVLILMFILAIVLFKANQNRKKGNNLLQQQKAEIEQQSHALHLAYEQIQHKTKKIVDSIQYAQKIQNAILPQSKQLEKILGKDNFFILYRPKDLVSGDFYFVEHQQSPQQRSFIAVADCTGHGVPGAFMSMIAYQILHECISKNICHYPKDILANLHINLRQSLRQEQNQSRDGLDIVLIMIENNKKLYYSGAMNPLYYVVTNEVHEWKATKKGIGGLQNPSVIDYEQQEMVLCEDIKLYLCSDGYADQFGGKENKKFLSKNLKNLLLQISHLPMSTQEKLLAEAHEKHKSMGKEKQTDDITILGISLKV